MQDFTVFDIVIVSITVLLGLKGLLRGLIKEVFALVGIVGGIFVASRMAEEIGINIAPLLALENQATIKLIGFIIGLVGFWVIVYILGIVLSKIFSASGLGIFDRILGFIFGAAKIFLIFSIIIYGLYQIQSFKSLMNEKIGASITFPFLIKTGGFIVQLDASDFVKKVEEKITPKKDIEEESNLIDKESIIKEVSDTAKEIKETAVESGTAVVDTIKKTVDEKVDEIAETIKDTSEETSEDLSKIKEKVETDKGN